MKGARHALGCLALGCLAFWGLAAAASAQDAAPLPASEWYLDRGTHVREAKPTDDIPAVAAELEMLMRDGGVPGFYDGQFASTADKPEALTRIARDKSMHHVLRMMAVMALQEAASGDELRAAVEPLIMKPGTEFSIEIEQFRERYRPSTDPSWMRAKLDAELSRYAHFALAKAGMPKATQAKIEQMEFPVRRKMHRILDSSLPTNVYTDVDEGRMLLFEIAYHYQQFDDYENAAIWFRKLTDSLPGMTESRWAHYNLACIASLTGKPKEGLEHLESAYEVGFLDIEWMDEDGDLAAVRALPEYQALKRRMLGL